MAAYRVDVVGYTRSTLSLDQQEARKKVFFTSLEGCPTYNGMRESVFTINLGDGVYLVANSRLAKHFLEIAKELQQNLNKDNQTLDPELHVNVRTGIHVGQAFVTTEDGKLVDVSGNAMSYAERIMSLGDPGDILLTASAANTMLATDSRYKSHLHYAGKYAIKHGDTLQVWYYSDSISGNPSPPRRKKEPLLLKMSTKNRNLGFSLLILSIGGLILSSVLLAADFRDSEADSRSGIIKSSIEDRVKGIWQIQDHAKEPIQRELAVAYGTSEGSFPRINETLNTEPTHKNLVTILDLLHSSNADIKYAWIAATAVEENPPDRCQIILYEPYGRIYDPTQNFTRRDWCLNLSDRTDYFTTLIYATGPDQFVNVMATRLNANDGPSATTVAYFGMGIQWNDLIPRMLTEIYGEVANVRLILEDHGGHISADCTPQGCIDLTEVAKSKTGIPEPDPQEYTRLSEAMRMDAAEYSGLPLETISLDPLDLPTARPEILKGWKVYLYYPQQQGALSPLSIGLFAISIASLAILVYYYIIPRFWLDDTDRLAPRAKFVYE